MPCTREALHTSLNCSADIASGAPCASDAPLGRFASDAPFVKDHHEWVVPSVERQMRQRGFFAANARRQGIGKGCRLRQTRHCVRCAICEEVYLAEGEPCITLSRLPRVG